MKKSNLLRSVFATVFSSAVLFAGGSLYADGPVNKDRALSPDDVAESSAAAMSTEERLAALENSWGKVDSWMKALYIGGKVRVRTEYKGPALYTVANGDRSDDFTLLRTKLHVGSQVTDNIRAFVELRDSRMFGENGGLVDDDEGVDLHQGYIEFSKMLSSAPFAKSVPEEMDLTIKVGRIMLPALGDQRMISPLDWHNVGRAFDGVEAHWKLTKNATLIFLHAALTEGAGVTGAGDDDDLTGLYFTSKPMPSLEADVYAFWRNFVNTKVTGEDGMSDDLTDVTYGARLAFKEGGFRATAEAALQDGDFANDDVDAMGWAIEGSFQTPKDTPLKPKIALGWTYASGDDNPTDGDQNTFRPIAPFGHAYQGHYDAFSWQNGHDYYVKTRIVPFANVGLHADYHIFRLAEREDSWYNAGGGAIRTDATGSSGKKVGKELDIYLKWTCSKRLKFWTGWSHFFDDSYVNRTGGGKEGDFFFFQMELAFGNSK